jgi:hypothetical protein
MKTYCGVEVQLHAFVNLGLDGSECLASRRGCFISAVTSSRHSLYTRLSDPKTGTDAVASRKISNHYPCRELNLCRLARSLVPVITELPRLPFM